MNSVNFDFRLSSKNGKTDVTSEIEKRLTEFGACELGPGKFYVSGIKMPDEASIFGMGAATKLILLPEINHGVADLMILFCGGVMIAAHVMYFVFLGKILCQNSKK